MYLIAFDSHIWCTDISIDALENSVESWIINYKKVKNVHDHQVSDYITFHISFWKLIRMKKNTSWLFPMQYPWFSLTISSMESVKMQNWLKLPAEQKQTMLVGDCRGLALQVERLHVKEKIQVQSLDHGHFSYCS